MYKYFNFLAGIREELVCWRRISGLNSPTRQLGSVSHPRGRGAARRRREGAPRIPAPHPKSHGGAKRRLPAPGGRIPDPLRTRTGGKRSAHLPGPVVRLPAQRSGQFFFLITTFFPHPKNANRAALIFFCCLYFKIRFFKVRFEEKN